MPIKMSKSNNHKKKYMITGTKKNGSKITRHFGAAGMRDRTKISNPEERKKATASYKARHRGDNLNDPYSAGSLSYYVLWSGDTIAAGKRAYKNKFGISL
jgi:hypothetical protein